MTQITGGEVTYERRVTTGDYQHKHLKVTLNFTVDEGQVTSAIAEETLSRALRLVEDGLRTKLGPVSLDAPTLSAAERYDRKVALSEAKTAERTGDSVKEAGMAAAINGMDALKEWWIKLPAGVRDKYYDFKEKTLKPQALDADTQINNNLRAG